MLSTPAHLLTACDGAAATCTLPEGDKDWVGEWGQVTTPLQIALEHGHATAAEVIIKGAAKAGADISASAEHAVDMLHKAPACKYLSKCSGTMSVHPDMVASCVLSLTRAITVLHSNKCAP
jgi:hypothetical protein